MELHENLEYQFRENLMEMGKSHKEAAEQVRDEKRIQECSDPCVCLYLSLITNING